MIERKSATIALCCALALACSSGERREVSSAPDEPALLDGVTAPLAATGRYSCAIRDDAVVCWGLHPRAGVEPSIASFEELAGSVQLAASDGMLCGRRADGTVHCNRRRFFRGGDAVEIAQMRGIDDAASVVVGGAHACVLHTDGRVSCWGSDDAGQLGAPDLGSRGAPVRVDVEDASALAAAGDRTCAIADGAIMCWGSVLEGEGAETPTRFEASGTWRAIALGARHQCALDAAGNARCWGSEALGATDPPSARFDGLVSGGYAACGHTAERWACWGRHGPSEAAVEAMAGADAIALGHEHGCFARGETISCWGDNGRGQVIGSTSHERPPSQVVGLDDAVDVQTHWGGRCALRRDGRVVCWGRLDPEPWRDDAPDTQAPRGSPVPVVREGVTDATELAVGHEHGCARTRDGHLSCWGSNEHGQLGIEGVEIARQAQLVTALEGVRAVCAGGAYTCVIDEDRAVRCVGASGEGDFRTPRWEAVRGAEGAERIACGADLACALLDGGDAVCWRDDLTRDRRSLPGRTPPPQRTSYPVARRFASEATALWVGDHHACVRTAAHPGLACFGYGDTGELGVERCGDEERCVLSRELVRFEEARADDAVFLAPGTCLRRGEGPVRCWGGRDPHYEGHSLEPETLEGTDGAVGLTRGCARFEDGTVKCWGSNRGGEVGDGTTGHFDAPREVPLP